MVRFGCGHCFPSPLLLPLGCRPRSPSSSSWSSSSLGHTDCPFFSLIRLCILCCRRRRRPWSSWSWSSSSCSSPTALCATLPILGHAPARPLSSFRFIRPRPSLTRAPASIHPGCFHAHAIHQHNAHRAAHAQARNARQQRTSDRLVIVVG